jgi:hypothetical protein
VTTVVFILQVLPSIFRKAVRMTLAFYTWPDLNAEFLRIFKQLFNAKRKRKSLSYMSTCKHILSIHVLNEEPLYHR